MMSQQKRKLYRIHLLLSLSLVYGCQSPPATSPQPGPTNLPIPTLRPTPIDSAPATASPEAELQIQALSEAEIQEVKTNPLIDANNRFALKLFQKLSAERRAKNLFVSPISVSLALQMAWNGAKKQTQAEMAKTLEIQDLSEELINRGAHLLMRKLVKPATDMQLEVANGIFVNQRYKLNPEFLNKNKVNFLAEIRNQYFQNGPTQTEINAWVKQQTHGKIPLVLNKIENPDEAREWEEKTNMFLLNAIYFKAKWSEEFETFETREREFYPAEGPSKKVMMMRQFSYYRYLSPNRPGLSNEFQSLELPYGKDKKIGMYLILPSYGNSLYATREAFLKMDLQVFFQSFAYESGSLILPKFKQEHQFPLNDALRHLGMNTAFDNNLANFDAMIDFSPDKEKFYLSNVIHFSNIEVNEEGTEAAAVTVIQPQATAVVSSPPITKQLEIVFDRPFMYLIRDNETGQILFMGNVYDPSVES